MLNSTQECQLLLIWVQKGWSSMIATIVGVLDSMAADTPLPAYGLTPRRSTGKGKWHRQYCFRRYWIAYRLPRSYHLLHKVIQAIDIAVSHRSVALDQCVD